MYVIAIEGPDKFGKTELAGRLTGALGYTYVKFPNEEIESGKELRSIINGDIYSNLLTYQVLQNQNKLDTLEKLPDGNYVFDRYKLSEIVYGKANGLADEFIWQCADKLPDPDVTILIVGRPYGQDTDIFSSDEFKRKVKELYNEAGKNADGRVIRVCNYKSLNEVFESVMKELKGVV